MIKKLAKRFAGLMALLICVGLSGAAEATTQVLNLDFSGDSYATGWSFSGTGGSYEQGTRTLSTGDSSTFLKLIAPKNNKARSEVAVYNFAANISSASSYVVELDWFAAMGFNDSLAYLRLMSGNDNLFSLEDPNAKNCQNTIGTIYGADGSLLGTYTTVGRGGDSSTASQWYHIKIVGDWNSGVVLTMSQGDTTVFGPTKVSDFRPITSLNTQVSTVAFGTTGGIDDVKVTIPDTCTWNGAATGGEWNQTGLNWEGKTESDELWKTAELCDNAVISTSTVSVVDNVFVSDLVLTNAALSISEGKTVTVKGAVNEMVSTNGIAIPSGVTAGALALTLAPRSTSTDEIKANDRSTASITLIGDQHLASLTGAGLVTADGNLNVDVLSGTQEFYGSLTNAMSLIKSGAGTLTLAGPNRFTGDVTVSAGTLKLAQHPLKSIMFHFDSAYTNNWEVDAETGKITSMYGGESGSERFTFNGGTGSNAVYVADSAYFGGKPVIRMNSGASYCYGHEQHSSQQIVVYQKNDCDFGSDDENVMFTAEQYPGNYKVRFGIYKKNYQSRDAWYGWNASSSQAANDCDKIYVDGVRSPRKVVNGKRQVLTLMDRISKASTRCSDQLGYAGQSYSGAIAEVIAFTEYLSMEDHFAYMAYLMQKWGCDEKLNNQMLPKTAAVSVAKGATLDLTEFTGDMALTVKSATIADGATINVDAIPADGILMKLSNGESWESIHVNVTVGGIAQVGYKVVSTDTELKLVQVGSAAITLGTPYGCTELVVTNAEGVAFTTGSSVTIGETLYITAKRDGGYKNVYITVNDASIAGPSSDTYVTGTYTVQSTDALTITTTATEITFATLTYTYDSGVASFSAKYGNTSYDSGTRWDVDVGRVITITYTLNDGYVLAEGCTVPETVTMTQDQTITVTTVALIGVTVNTPANATLTSVKVGEETIEKAADGKYYVAPNAEVTATYTAKEGYLPAMFTASVTAAEGSVITSETTPTLGAAKIGTTAYATVQAAIEAAEDGNTIVFLQDADVSSFVKYEIAKNLTFDFNKKAITGSNGQNFIVVSDKTLTVNATGATITGVRINAGKNTNNNGNVVVNGGTWSVTGAQTVFHVNGTCYNSSLKLYDATITSASDNGIQLSGYGEHVISNCTITGATAVYCKAGKITITGSTLRATGEADYSYNGNGSNATGDAIVIDNCGYPAGPAQITLGAGTVLASDHKDQLGYYVYVKDGTACTEGTVKKASTVEVNTPTGYKWGTAVEGVQTLKKIQHPNFSQSIDAGVKSVTYTTNNVEVTIDQINAFDIDDKKVVTVTYELYTGYVLASGCTVPETITFNAAEAQTLTITTAAKVVEVESEDEMKEAINDDIEAGKNPTGKYVINDGTTTTEKAVVVELNQPATTIVGVPSKTTADKLIDAAKSGIANDDKLWIYDRTLNDNKGGYVTFRWDSATSTWVSTSTEETKPVASEYEVAVGTAAFVERANGNSAIVQITDYSSTAADPITVTHDADLVAPATMADYNLNTEGNVSNANDDDQIKVVVGNNYRTYTLEDGQWGYSKLGEAKEITIGNKTIKVQSTERVNTAVVPAGQGFFYLKDKNGANTPSIKVK